MNRHQLHITLCANDFPSGSSQYTWDANGNLVSDSGKGVVSVAYNRFNLPVAVDLGDRGDISFTYDGLGRKLSMSSRPKLTINPLAKSAPKEITGGIADGGKIDGDFPVAEIDFFSRYYYDNLIFKGTQLERILFPGGYITPSGTQYVYHYYVTDRQGNVRAVVRDGNLVEANDYYPYGMLMADADGKIPDKQPYKLSGKEYITTRGLNLYDFGARMHDPAAMRFSTPDPLMEQYPSLSPYTYCAANPLKYIDPTGLTTYVIGQDGNLKGKDETKKDDSVVVVDDEGNEIDTFNFNRKVIFGGGFKIKSGTYTFDYYQIYGSSNAINLFIFLASNTKVEWSLILYGGENSRRAYLSTSHSENHEDGLKSILNNPLQLKNNFQIHSIYHNHKAMTGGLLPSTTDIAQSKQIAERCKGDYKNMYNIEFWLFIHDIPDLIYRYYPDTTPVDYYDDAINNLINRILFERE